MVNIMSVSGQCHVQYQVLYQCHGKYINIMVIIWSVLRSVYGQYFNASINASIKVSESNTFSGRLCEHYYMKKT